MVKKKASSKVTQMAAKSGYASVNGVNLYYEIGGTGEPLILLHDGVGASEMFDVVIPTLAENRQIVAVHLQAHGRTTDIERHSASS